MPDSQFSLRWIVSCAVAVAVAILFASSGAFRTATGGGCEVSKDPLILPCGNIGGGTCTQTHADCDPDGAINATICNSECGGSDCSFDSNCQDHGDICAVIDRECAEGAGGV